MIRFFLSFFCCIGSGLAANALRLEFFVRPSDYHLWVSASVSGSFYPSGRIYANFLLYHQDQDVKESFKLEMLPSQDGISFLGSFVAGAYLDFGEMTRSSQGVDDGGRPPLEFRPFGLHNFSVLAFRIDRERCLSIPLGRRQIKIDYTEKPYGLVIKPETYK